MRLSNTAYASGSTMSQKHEMVSDHIVLSLYGPSGGTKACVAISEENTRKLIKKLELALGDLAEKRTLKGS